MSFQEGVDLNCWSKTRRAREYMRQLPVKLSSAMVWTFATWNRTVGPSGLLAIWMKRSVRLRGSKRRMVSQERSSAISLATARRPLESSLGSRLAWGRRRERSSRRWR